MAKFHSNQIILASAQRSAGTGTSNILNLHSYDFAVVAIHITAKSGAPTLDVSLEMSPVDPSKDGSQWYTVYKETQITNADLASGSDPWNFLGHEQRGFLGWVRISYTVGGATTPKLTFQANILAK